MSETVATETSAAGERATPELEAAPGHEAAHDAHGEHGDHGDHPSPAKYVGIALILAFVTAIEVALYYIELNDQLMVGMLMVLAIFKFAMVAAYFMHLKFDQRMLRRLFVTGIVLALFCYCVVLFTLDILVG